MNTITIEFCKEDRKRIDELIALAGLIVGELKSSSAPVDRSQDSPESVTPSIIKAEDGTVKLVKEDHPIDATTAHLEPVEPVEESPDKNANEAPEVKPVSLAEFQKAVTIVCAKGPKQKEAARATINKYAASVSAVPEDKRAEVMAELAKI
jgi:hypothetical protein